MSDYRLAPGVHWMVERYSIAVTRPHATRLTLPYPAAAVWDLFSRGYPFARVVSMVEHIASIEPAAADRLVRSLLEQWVEEGFVERQ